MKKQEYENRLKELYDNIKGVAKIGADQFTKLEQFVSSYECPQKFGDRGVELVSHQLNGDRKTTIKSTVSEIRLSLKEYQKLREEYLEKFYPCILEPEENGWETIGRDTGLPLI